jgi:serine protease Do
LVNPISLAQIGSKVKINYVRERAQKETTATVEDRTRVFPNAAGRMGEQPGEQAPPEFGLHVKELTPDRARQLGMDGSKGVLVSDVDPASFADDLGFGRGDVIAEVNRQSVNTVDEYQKAVSQLKPGSNVVFKVLRKADGDRVLTVFLPGIVPAENQK